MDVGLRRWRRRPRRSGGLLALRFSIVTLSALVFALLAGVLAVAGSAYGVYAFYAQDLPSADEISQMYDAGSFETTRLYDRTGETVLYEIISPDIDRGRRTWVPLSRIPEHLRNATIAVEDKTFYTNLWGINVEGILRAVGGQLRGEYAGGGSSIPQQLVRNTVYSFDDRTDRDVLLVFRKVRELVLTVELARRYPGVEGRDRILEWYLNQNFYGHHAYGVEAAAQTYFDKSVDELTLPESAMLVPVGNAPVLNPIDEFEEAKKRQELVLDQMYLQGYVTAEEAWAAKQETLVIAPPGFDITVPHFVLYARKVLEQKYGSDAVYGGGLQVITSIDLEIQAKAEEIARQHIDEISEERNAHNAAIVVIDAKTAEIVALVGSLDFRDEAIDGEVDMAATNARGPGSSFKPFTYATALAQGYTLATMVMDRDTTFVLTTGERYTPPNYSRRFHGPVTFRQALARSLNVPAVAVMEMVGPKRVVETAHAMGITTLNEGKHELSLGLGSYPVKLLDMAFAFSVFANGGTMLGERVPSDSYVPGHRRLEPVSVLTVADPDGSSLYAYGGPQRQEVIRPEIAYLINDTLSDNDVRAPSFGVDSYIRIDERPAAAKTGTNQQNDAWTIGYTPQYVVAVWVGNADHSDMKGASGVRLAGPIWQQLIRFLHDGLPVEAFDRPEGIETAIVDCKSGKLPTEYSPCRMQEIFVAGTVPTEEDDVHRPFRICRQSGKLATVYCPAHDVQEVVFEIYPPDAEDWVREQEIPQPPDEHCDIHGPNLTKEDVAIVNPRLFEIVRDIVPVMGNAKPGSLQKHWLDYGEGMDPEYWVRVGAEHGHRVDNGVLENWDTTGLDGLYTLRLSVVEGGNLRQAAVPVLVDNISPTLDVLLPGYTELSEIRGYPPIGLEPPEWHVYLDGLQDCAGLWEAKPNSVKPGIWANYLYNLRRCRPSSWEWWPTSLTENRLETVLAETFELGTDEWIDIQVDAQDSTSLERVEFYLDEHLLGYKTVAPYTLRWTLAMSNVVPALDLTPRAPVETVVGEDIVGAEVSDVEGTRVLTEMIRHGEAMTVTQAVVGPDGLSYVMSWPSGRRIISDTLGYTETHSIHVLAFDVAGNEMKSEPVMVHVVRKPKEEE